jgi:hypothetical protein
LTAVPSFSRWSKKTLTLLSLSRSDDARSAENPDERPNAG